MTDIAAERQRAADISKYCAAAGVAERAPEFIAAGLSLDEVKAKVDLGGQIRATVERAHAVNRAIPLELADTLIAAGLTLQEARYAVHDALVAAQAPHINSGVSPDAAPAMPGSQAAKMWDASIKKIVGS